MTKRRRAARHRLPGPPNDARKNWCHVYNAGDGIMEVIADFAAHYDARPDQPWTPKGSTVTQMVAEIDLMTAALDKALIRASRLINRDRSRMIRIYRSMSRLTPRTGFVDACRLQTRGDHCWTRHPMTNASVHQPADHDVQPCGSKCENAIEIVVPRDAPVLTDRAATMLLQALRSATRPTCKARTSR